MQTLYLTGHKGQTNSTRLSLACAILFMYVFISGATEIAPLKCIVSSKEVISFSVNQSNVIAVFGNGGVGVWNFSSGEMVHQFNIPVEDMSPVVGHHEVLSHGSSASLITLTDTGTIVGDKFFFTINVYDPNGSRKQIHPTVELANPFNCGCADNTLILADRPPNNAVVAAIDIGTGRTVWRSETDDNVQTGTIVLGSGECYVNFCQDRCLRARNQSGKLLWKWRVPNGKFAEPGYWPENPVLPYVVVYESQDDGVEVVDFVALSAKRGKTVWRRKMVKFNSLKAISNDGQHQIFQRGQVEITALPKLDKPKIVSLSEEQDAVFSADGHTAFCLPSLLTVSTDLKNNSYTEARKSGRLSVIAVESGEIIKQFSLVLSTQKDSERSK